MTLSLNSSRLIKRNVTIDHQCENQMEALIKQRCFRSHWIRSTLNGFVFLLKNKCNWLAMAIEKNCLHNGTRFEPMSLKDIIFKIQIQIQIGRCSDQCPCIFSLIFLATADVSRIKQMMRRMTFSLIVEFSLYSSVLPWKRRLLRKTHLSRPSSLHRFHSTLGPKYFRIWHLWVQNYFYPTKRFCL